MGVVSPKEVSSQDTSVCDALYDPELTGVISSCNVNGCTKKMPWTGKSSPLTVFTDLDTLLAKVGGCPSYSSSRCLASNTDTAAPVSMRHWVVFPLICTSTIGSSERGTWPEVLAICWSFLGDSRALLCSGELVLTWSLVGNLVGKCWAGTASSLISVAISTMSDTTTASSKVTVGSIGLLWTCRVPVVSGSDS